MNIFIREKANIGAVCRHKPINCEEIINVSADVYICYFYSEIMKSFI